MEVKFCRKFRKTFELRKSTNDLIEITNNFVQSKSYNLFSNYWHHLSIENYKSLSRHGKKKGIGEIAKILGRNWKKLTDKEKTPYALAAEKDKERYQTNRRKS